MSRIAPEEKYQGVRTHESLKLGPVHRKRCTDIICLFAFISMWAGLVLIAVYGYNHGDPLEIISPYDQYGKPCGLYDQKGFPYIYFVASGGVIQPNQGICVEKCPDSANSVLNCAPDVASAGGDCKQIGAYPTISFVGKICLPTDQDDLNVLADAKVFDMDPLFKAVSDLEAGWWLICIVGVIGICLGFIYMLFMRFCSGVVTWGILVFYEVGLCIFGGICLLESSGNSLVANITPTELSSISPVALKTIGYACFALAVISLFVMCIFIDRIRLGVTVLQAAAEFIESNPSTLLIPPIFFLLSLAFYVFWIFTFIYLLGTNNINAQPNSLPFSQVNWNDETKALFAFLIISLIWIHAFLHALPQFVIASTACIWYFRTTTKHESPLLTSICRAILHLGSIAFGALMVGILDFLRMMFGLLERTLIDSKNDQNHCCNTYFCCCARVCLGCFNCCLKFIDRHVYIQIAMTGKSYCPATKDAFYLILRNCLRFGTIHGMGTIFVFFGEMFITFFSTFIGYLIVKNQSYFQQELFSPLIMTLFFGLISLIIGHIFMSVYGVAADAIVHCYAMDDELHPEGAKYVPNRLKSLVSMSARQKLLSRS